MSQLSNADLTAGGRFIAERVKHHHPIHASLMGSEALLQFGVYAVGRAARRHLTHVEDVAVYTLIMVHLGSHFDEDPLLAWAHPQWSSEREASSAVRTLHHRVVEFSAAAAGKNGEDHLRALRSIRKAPFLQGPPAIGNSLVPFVTALHPPKAQLLVESAMAKLPTLAHSTALELGLTDNRAPAMCATLLFMLGAGFARDPQYPHIAEALSGTDETREFDAMIRLYTSSMAYIEKLLAAFDGSFNSPG